MRIEVVSGAVMSGDYVIDVLIVVIVIHELVVKSCQVSMVLNLLVIHILIRMHRHVLE